jgi:hypothetical protein
MVNDVAIPRAWPIIAVQAVAAAFLATGMAFGTGHLIGAQIS